MKYLKLIFIILTTLFFQNIFAQRNQTIGNIEYDETLLYAEVKQVNQFFRRFNNEEDAFGVKYATENPNYHNNETRSRYFNALFDKHSLLLDKATVKDFTQFVLNPKKPCFLDFYTTHWYAEVSANVLWNNKESKNFTYYLKLEQDREGHKWVISNVYFSPFDCFPVLPDSVKNEHFLHPKSHEIDFINLQKEFRDPEFLSAYFHKNFTPDMLTLFLYETNKGNIRFQNVNTIKIHFLLEEGWYFELSYMNRSDMNSGWLITNLLPISKENYLELIKTFDHK